MRAALLPAVLGLTLAGCASPVPRRPAPVSLGDQGGAWEVVLPGPNTELAMGPEAERRDAALSPRDVGAFAAADWPDPDRPSLENARRLQIDGRADEVIYFRSRRASRWPGWR